MAGSVADYCLDGTWDEHVASIGSYAYADTNLTAIYQTMDLLWRNNINPGRVNMGLGFYGRSKPMHSPRSHLGRYMPALTNT